MILEELFPTLRDLQDIVAGLETSDTFATLNSSALSAKKQITNIITLPIYKSLQADDEAKVYLQIALGNLTLAKDTVFGVIRKRKNDVDLYKHEMEAMRREYINTYYNAMDSIISHLESQPEDKHKWKETPYCKLREKLRIKSTEEFELLYPIDNSYLFFFRTIPLQKEILDDTISDYYLRAEEKTKLIDKLNHALTKLTVATAIRRFDPLELPATIRNLHDDSTTQRQCSTEQSRLLKLANELTNNAVDIIRAVETALTEPDTTNVETQTSFNRPDDKIYLMS